MVSQVFKECLAEIYIGEQNGEAILDAMLPNAQNEDQRYILGSLLQLETEGKAQLRPMMMKFGVSMVENPSSKSYGTSVGEQLNQMSWIDQFAAMANGIERVYLAKYEELAKQVSEQEDAEAYKLATFMGAHERAFLAAARNVAVGHPDPVSPVVELLHFPLVKPTSS